jgi:peptidoglycan/xylan/chitin deacetylase (PgdA/CDA1 family)
VKATFFVCGYWVEKYPEDIEMLYEKGQDIGNHSATHPDMTTLSDEQREEELMKVHNLVYDLIGYEMFLFRPPYGAYDESVVNSARACEYYTIQWDVEGINIKVKTQKNL